MFNQAKPKIYFIILIVLAFNAFLLFFCLPASAAPTADDIQFRPPISFGPDMDIKDLPDYIKAAYNFSTAAIVVLCIVMVLIGGVQWIISAGDSGKIGKAQDRIMKALTGLAIALFATVMLYQINPNLLTFSLGKGLTPLSVQLCCMKGGKPTLTERCAPADILAPVQCLESPGGGGGYTPPPAVYCGAAGTSSPTAVCKPGPTCPPGDTPRSEPCPNTGEVCCDQPIKKACTDSDYTTACTAAEYCASTTAGGTSGFCMPKQEAGFDCMDDNTVSKDKDDMCKSDNCFTKTYSTFMTKCGFVTKCAPKDGMGVKGERCFHKTMCASGLCYTDSQGACEGRCDDPLASGIECEDRNLDNMGSDDDAPCATGTCPTWTAGVKSKCP